MEEVFVKKPGQGVKQLQKAKQKKNKQYEKSVWTQ